MQLLVSELQGAQEAYRNGGEKLVDTAQLQESAAALGRLRDRLVSLAAIFGLCN